MLFINVSGLPQSHQRLIWLLLEILQKRKHLHTYKARINLIAFAYHLHICTDTFAIIKWEREDTYFSALFPVLNPSIVGNICHKQLWNPAFHPIKSKTLARLLSTQWHMQSKEEGFRWGFHMKGKKILSMVSFCDCFHCLKRVASNPPPQQISSITST